MLNATDIQSSIGKKILVVDDEQDILELLEYNLIKEGFQVTCATTGEDAIDIVNNDSLDLILLDIMLPGISGMDVLKYLNNEKITKSVPVLFLSAKSEEIDVIVGLELGACDYITKPFKLKVLIARIKAVLRNWFESAEYEPDIIKVGDLLIHLGQRRVYFKGKDVELTNVEFNILRLMAKKPRAVFSRFQITEAIHDEEHCVTDRSVDVQIYGLRKKLGNGKGCIETVRRVGYRLIA